LKHLFKTYGYVSPQQPKWRDIEICSMNFIITHPVDAVFNEIELSEYAYTPMYKNQAINLAFLIFTKNSIMFQ